MEAPILIVPMVVFLFSTILPFYQGEGVSSSLIAMESEGLGGMNGTLFLLTLMALLGTKFFHLENPALYNLGKGLYVSYATIGLLMLAQRVILEGAPLFNGEAAPGSGLIVGLTGILLSYGALIYLVGIPYIKAIRDAMQKP
ncbi:MAG: hypothetical protein ACOCU0_00660 [Bacillota bacterium]